jgi:uncharacterized protein (DUF302 family)
MTVASFETTVARPLDAVEARVREALGEQGFGVLTEIDVAATLRAKLGVERPPLKILGACNPDFANRALQAEPSVGLMLPCNVVLEATDDGTHVAIIDPRSMLDTPALADLANDAADRLRSVVDGLDAQ